MDLSTALRVTARHWVVAGLVLALSAVAAVAAGSRVAVEYEARTTVIFLSPSVGYDANGKPFRVNPFARAGTAERLAASTVLTVTRTEDFEKRMKRLGALGSYSLTPTSEVTVDVVTRSTDPEMTIETSRAAVRLVQEELVERQRRADAPKDTWITAEALSTPDEPAMLTGSRIRVVVGVAVIGLVAAVSAAFVADAITGRRTRRRRPAHAARSGLQLDLDEPGERQAPILLDADHPLLRPRPTATTQTTADRA